MNKKPMFQRSGFSLVECVVLVAIAGLFVAVAVPMLGAARLQMRGMESDHKLMVIGQGGEMYSRDNGGRIFSFSWRAGGTYMLPNGQIRTPSTQSDAAAFQEQEVLMRLSGRISGNFKILDNSGQFAPRRMSHIVLIDHLGLSLGDELFIDPADSNQFEWSQNPLSYGPGSGVPYADGVSPGYEEGQNWLNTSARQRWAYASSFQVIASAWNSDFPNPRVLPISSTPHQYQIVNGSDATAGRFRSEVLFPSAKVYMFEEFDRERNGTPYFAYPVARPSKLMFDGSINTDRTSMAERIVLREFGFGEWTQFYKPLDRFPIPLGGLNSTQMLNPRYQWTTQGLHGMDFPMRDAPRGPRVKRVGP